MRAFYCAVKGAVYLEGNKDHDDKDCSARDDPKLHRFVWVHQ